MTKYVIGYMSSEYEYPVREVIIDANDISDAVDYARARFPGVCKESLEMPIHGFQIYNADLEVIRSYSAEASDC